MLSTAKWQIPYPVSGDHTRTWEYWQAMAERVDACLTQIGHITLVEQGAVQSIPNAAYTALNFDLESIDTSNMHSTSSNTGRLTATVPGYYVLNGVCPFAGNATGRRLVTWFVNGSQTPACYVGLAPLAGAVTAIPAPAYGVRLAVGDYVELRAFQDSGAALNTGSTPTSQRAFASAQYICP